MPTIATGINKLLTFKKQSALGVAAGTGSGQNLRRVSSSLEKKKASYQSKELLTSQQRRDMRHGVVSVDGTIAGELSVGTYQSFIESMLRQLALTAITITTSTSDVVSAAVGANGGTITVTSAGLMAGTKFKVGMVVRCTGFTTTATGNNTKNLFITALTDSVMTVVTLDSTAFIAKTETAAVTITEVGKHTFVPATGQLRDYYTIEHNFTDIVQSEKFTDCMITQMDVKLPASGMATVDFNVMGLNMTPGTTGYFVSPTAVSTGGILAAANGVMYMQGVAIGLITGMNFAVKGNHTTIGGVVGSNQEPDIFPGSIDCDGQVTVLFTDATVRDYFLNETEVSLYCAFTTDNTSTAGFIAISLPRCKMGGAAKDDGEKGLVMTMPFTALENTTGGAGTASHASTIAIQDSAFV
jgi:hypothetical protein